MPGKGKGYEISLAIQNAEYHRQGRAFVFRCHPEAKMIHGTVVYTGKGVPDFSGVLKGGRMVCFEAKEVSKGSRFPFPSLPEHQAIALTNVLGMGGVAFVTVRFKEFTEDRLYDWNIHSMAYLQWLTSGMRPASWLREDGILIKPGGWLPIVAP